MNEGQDKINTVLNHGCDKKQIPSPTVPFYWVQACEQLSANDRIMKRLITQFPKVVFESKGDAFSTLARSIVGQQISVKAAQSVWERFLQLPAFTNSSSYVHNTPTSSSTATPELLLNMNIPILRTAGLSQRKCEYLVDLAKDAIQSNWHTWHITHWQQWSDEEITQQLTAVRGIGRWTAEMFLMFYLLRPNVLPLDDIGLLNGIRDNYFSGEAISRNDAKEVAKAWDPHCTVATWYIWRSLDPIPVAY